MDEVEGRGDRKEVDRWLQRLEKVMREVRVRSEINRRKAD